ncbi:MAG: alkylated DNA repair protein (DNA oxidative demethylase) [Bradymonadia bacterium]|jgi:alkylated DNA repair protein (DNA oxidative demethylase)
MSEPSDGRLPIEQPGFSYLPRFITNEEAEALIAYFASLNPMWERRHVDDASARGAGHNRRLTRPVYWLGAWQFACLGYYAEPDHREHRCLSGEPFPKIIDGILERLVPTLAKDHVWPDRDAGEPTLPNTCLVNYYGREVSEQNPPRDYARLRMHRDGEPGPVIMFNIGQPGLFEFLDPDRSREPEVALWTRHRSVTIISGPEFKDRLYHLVSAVRTGREPRMECRVPNFELRRVSVSFRHVPTELVQDLGEFPAQRRDAIVGYVKELAETSEHYQRQLASVNDAAER